MRKNLRLVTVFLVIALLLPACKAKETVVTTEYQTTQNTIDINDYALKGQSDFIGLKDLLEVNGMIINQCCFYSKDEIAVLYTDANFKKARLNIFSLKTGDSDVIADWELKSQNCDGYFSIVSTKPLVILDNCDNCYYIYNSASQTMDVIETKCTRYGCSIYGNQTVYYIENGNILAKSTNEDDSLVYDNSNNPDVIINMVRSMADDDQKIIVSGFDAAQQTDEIYVVDITTGKIVNKIAADFIYSESSNYSYTYKSYDSIVTVDRHKRNDINNITTYEYPSLYYANYYNVINDMLILQETDTNSMQFKFCNLNDGEINYSGIFDTCKYKQDYSIPDDKYLYTQFNPINVLSEDYSRLIFILCKDSDREEVVIWNITSEPEEQNKLTVNNRIDDNDYSYTDLDRDDYSKKVKNIYSKYGVRIFYGDNISTEFPDYSVEKIDDDEMVGKAIDTLTDIFNKYPDGFFKYLISDGYLSGMSVFLTGKISPSSDTSISNAAGFAVVNHDMQIIVVDIRSLDSFEADMFHEISHAIFDRINYQESLDGVDYFNEDEWNLLNPAGFTYYQSYLDENGQGYDGSLDDMYTGNHYFTDWKLDNVYFVDTYAKTFLTEDLARLMEYDMSYGSTVEYMTSTHIKEKLDFYYKAIRAAWDSSTWPAQTSWEQ